MTTPAHSVLYIYKHAYKGKGFPLEAQAASWGSRRLRLLDHLDIRHYEGGKVVTLTACVLATLFV